MAGQRLANEVVEELKVPPTEPITVEHMEQAKERLILARATHLDSLAAKLAEDRGRRVIEPVLAGTLARDETYDDDLAYTRDLGLVASTRPVRRARRRPAHALRYPGAPEPATCGTAWR